MANFNSDAVRKGTRYRVLKDGSTTISATVKIPAGIALAASDTLTFFDLGPNVDIASLTLTTSSSVFDDGNGTVAVGVVGDTDAFVATSTGLQSGARGFRIEKPFVSWAPAPVTKATVNAPRTSDSITASSRVTAPSGSTTVLATIVNAGTQTTSDNSVRYITLTAEIVPLLINTPSQLPYEYADRRDNTTLSSNGLVSPTGTPDNF